MKRRAFPYQRVARLWANGRTIREIGERIGYVNQGRDDGDRFHTLRNFLLRMHRGYPDRKGRMVRLPYRVSRAVVRAAKLRASD
jgi:hypothetical protein